MASEYGLTPEQFLSFTPRQLQITIEALEIRTHNAKAFLAQLQGRKMDMINPDARALERQILNQHAEQERARNDR